jgi:hypothetical protein
MTTTNVPQITFSAAGVIIPTAEDVLRGVIADMQQAFGGVLTLSADVPITLSTPQGQLATSWAAEIFSAYENFLYQSTQTDPAYAVGRWQDAIARIYFIYRIGAQPTVLQVACLGLNGVPIPVGSVIRDAAGNIYSCTTDGVIPVSGTITLPFANTVTGPIGVPGTNEVSIYQAIPGWDSVTVASGVLGNTTESRSAFETRRAATVAGNSFGAIGSIIGKVAQVPGVTDYFGYDNATGSPATIAGVTVPARSIYIAAVGGDPAAIAQAIWSKKAPGCGYFGNTTVTVYDPNPVYDTPPSYQVSFEIPGALQILFAVNMKTNAFVPANAVTLIQNAIINAFAGGDGGPRARLGSTLFASRFYSAVGLLGSWAQLVSLYVGSNNNPGAIFAGTIAGTTLTVASTASGAVAIGQTISDANGDIAAGTVITAGSGASWTVSRSQTVAGASFTGTGSGTNLTVSAVTGKIEVGNTIAGTGVPAGTKIVSQTSGTPGGAGVYVTSGATTSSAAALTAAKTITGAVPNLNDLSVDADQEPEIVADNIAVVFA